MRRRSLLLGAVLALPVALAAAGALAGGCAPSVETTPGSGGSGGHGRFGFGGAGGFAEGGSDAGLDALPDYVDPGCPDAGPKQMMFMCDPYNQGNGDCMPAEGCYIFVQYPDEPCGQEVYGAACQPVGPGMQGADCTGPEDCAAGFSCVVTGSGVQCTQLCELTGPSGCPDGLVCEPIDVEGFGGCL